MVSTALAVVGMFCTSAVLADTAPWTLERALTRGHAVAPETRALEYQVEARRAAREQAGRWPNPVLDAQASELLGNEDGRGGYALTELGLSQPLPLWGQVRHGRDAAEARLAEAQALAGAGRLGLEAGIGAAFHEWQQAEADYRLARQRLAEAGRLERIARLRHERGDLSEREQLRIQLFHSEAIRQLEAAEGERSEARASLAAWLELQPNELGTAPPFADPPMEAVQLAATRDELDGHPALRAALERERAAQSEIARVRAEGRPDLVVRLFQERTVIENSREGSLGIGVQLELPLWDRNQGRVRENAAEHRRLQAESAALRRDLATQVTVSAEHLAHLLQELARHRRETLVPARRVRELTYRGYETGEVTLLELLEAYNTDFDAIRHEQLLLAESWEEWRKLRLSSGRSLLENTR
ncbi:MAG: TolC family protein [Chromatiales bacterium]|nr:TolC family protein [Chromatiales bacterium]